jgi:hypothetical protein
MNIGYRELRVGFKCAASECDHGSRARPATQLVLRRQEPSGYGDTFDFDVPGRIAETGDNQHACSMCEPSTAARPERTAGMSASLRTIVVIFTRFSMLMPAERSCASKLCHANLVCVSASPARCFSARLRQISTHSIAAVALHGGSEAPGRCHQVFGGTWSWAGRRSWETQLPVPPYCAEAKAFATANAC